MIIKKVVSFEESDREALISTGQFLAVLKKKFENKEVDVIDSESKELINALAEVTNDLMTKINEEN